MSVTDDVLLSALRAVGAGSRLVRPAAELAAGADAALRQAPPGLTAVGSASWMATQCMEGDYCRTTKEYAKDPPYAPWVGRTFEQLTHREAYDRFGAWCAARGLVADAKVFVKNPAALEDPRWAWLGGVFYFEWRDLWPIANRGDHLLVSRIVNAGPGWKRLGANWLPHGWDARRKMFDSFRSHGDRLLPTGSAPANSGRRTLRQGDSGGDVVELQRVLAAWYPDLRLVADGQFGPATKRAVETLQRNSRLVVDGIAGPATYRKLGLT